MKAAVYRVFDADGRLLYVGSTLNPIERISQHRAERPWWGEVATIGITHYPRLRQARDAEREAIETENPAYNVTFAGPGRRRSSVNPNPTFASVQGGAS